MPPRFRSIVVTRITRAGWPVALLLLACCQLEAQTADLGVLCLKGIGPSQRELLTSNLRRITGSTDLRFDQQGRLHPGKVFVNGSARARRLIEQAASGSEAIVLEDVSRNPDVVFSRVLSAQRKSNALSGPPVFVIQIDFADFEHVMGDRRALQSFDVGWVFLHEIDHIVNDSVDGSYAHEPGECEEHINLMRRECNLPERASYFFTLLPNPRDVQVTRFVRLAFEKGSGGSRKKYWLVWDANLVGGLKQEEIAAVR